MQTYMKPVVKDQCLTLKWYCSVRGVFAPSLVTHSVLLTCQLCCVCVCGKPGKLFPPHYPLLPRVSIISPSGPETVSVDCQSKIAQPLLLHNLCVGGRKVNNYTPGCTMYVCILSCLTQRHDGACSIF